MIKYILPSILLGIILPLLFSSCSQEEKPKKPTSIEYLTYKEALKKSQNNKRLIMIKLTSKGCHFCIKMDNEVMNKAEVIALIQNNFLAVEIDINKDSLPLGIKKSITPTFLFVNSDEKIIKKIPGAWNKKDFIEILDSILEKKGANSAKS